MKLSQWLLVSLISACLRDLPLAEAFYKTVKVLRQNGITIHHLRVYWKVDNKAEKRNKNSHKQESVVSACMFFFIFKYT